MRKGVVTVLGFLLSAGPSAAQAPEPEPFVALFSSSCVKYFYAPDKLAAALDGSKALRLAGEDAVPFLGGVPGAAWALRLPSGRYVVALRTDRVCAVFAHRAPAEAVGKSFEAMAAASPEPLVAEKLAMVDGPNSETARTVGWSWSRPGDPMALTFALTTSTDKAASIQAMASISLVRKPDPAEDQRGAVKP